MVKVMSLYKEYLLEIENRKKDGLKPKPIEDGELLKEIILQIKDPIISTEKTQLNFLFTTLFLERHQLLWKNLSF